MASKTGSSLALFLTLNLLFFSLVSACGSYSCPGPKPKPKPNPTPSGSGTCPRDALKLGVCANVLNGLLNVTLGQPPVTPCCTLIQGLADLEAAVCLCTALKANILGINLNLPISLSLLLNVCSKQVPRNFNSLSGEPPNHRLPKLRTRTSVSPLPLNHRLGKLQATVSDHSDKPPSPSTLSVGIFEHLRLPSVRHGVFSTGSLFVTVGPQVVNSEGQTIRITYEVLK
ncbi:hypothetical protein RJT34_33535 [Clitoria ternatea]|uniref:Bifunctional inhibitor/plant lipid transfer protein/seed storage helical domain-containing protein n=1 Tax=Clitoria ternatea TaxID=43366 RepID=A0AAN9F053_CLITE